jgi:hypothetical protein
MHLLVGSTWHVPQGGRLLLLLMMSIALLDHRLCPSVAHIQWCGPAAVRDVHVQPHAAEDKSVACEGQSGALQHELCWSQLVSAGTRVESHHMQEVLT